MLLKGRTVAMRVPVTMTQLCVNTATEGTQVNDQRGCVPIKLYLYSRKYEFRIMFMGHKMVFFRLFFPATI